MKKQTIGIYMFWIGVIGLVFNYLKQWITNPIFRDNSVEDLIETIWAADGFLFILNGMLTLFGIGFTIIGILLYSANKGSCFWFMATIATSSSSIRDWRRNYYFVLSWCVMELD